MIERWLMYVLIGPQYNGPGIDSSGHNDARTTSSCATQYIKKLN